MTLLAITPLVSAAFGQVIVSLAFMAIGTLAAIQGWVFYTEPIPRFVQGYRGFSCTPLSLLFGGVAFLLSPVGLMGSFIPRVVGGIIALTCLSCILVFFLGFFIWFPRFLLPPWYRRAVKAGVPRHDPLAMGAFKALPISEQRQLVSFTTRPEHQPPPIPTTPPTTQIPITNPTRATTSLPTLPGLSAGITTGLDKDKEQP